VCISYAHKDSYLSASRYDEKKKKKRNGDTYKKKEEIKKGRKKKIMKKSVQVLRVLRGYRRALRATDKVFAGDENINVARRYVRDQFRAHVGETDESVIGTSRYVYRTRYNIYVIKFIHTHTLYRGTN